MNDKYTSVEEFISIEPAFRLSCYHKGVDYGIYSRNGELIEEKNVELKIIYNDSDGVDDNFMFDFILDIDQVKKLKDYIKKVIDNEY